MKTNIYIHSNVIESRMHGVFQFVLLAGNRLQLRYTDGSMEDAVIPAGLAEEVRAYYRYQVENGPEAPTPNTFALVHAVQGQRPPR